MSSTQLYWLDTFSLLNDGVKLTFLCVGLVCVCQARMNNMKSPTQPKQPKKRLNVVLIKTEFCQNASVRVLFSNYLNVRTAEGIESSSPCLIKTVCVLGRTERRPSCLNTMMESSFPSVMNSLNMRSWRRSARELSGEYLMLV